MIFSLAFHEDWPRRPGTPTFVRQRLIGAASAGDGNLSLRRDRDVVLEFVAARWRRNCPRPRDGDRARPCDRVDVVSDAHRARSCGDVATIQPRCLPRHSPASGTGMGRPEFGAKMFLASDADGRQEVGWQHAETKLWWPHTEAAGCTPRCWRRKSRAEPWCMEWHERRARGGSAMRTTPVAGPGEMARQKLDRQGRPITQTLVLPVKDPFHLPRALIYCVEVLERLGGFR